MAAATYSVRLTPTAQTTAKTLVQLKAGAAPLEIVEVRFSQITKITSEILLLQAIRKSAAATVTSFTPLKLDTSSATALAVGGTAATGTNASAEGTDGEIPFETHWNIINGEFVYLPVPEARIWVPQAGIIGFKLATAPAASMSLGCIVTFREYA
jgi:hypothetical protein